MKLRLIFFAMLAVLVFASCRDQLNGPPANTLSNSDTLAFYPHPLIDGKDVSGNGHNGIVPTSGHIPVGDKDRFGNTSLTSYGAIKVTNTSGLDFTVNDSYTVSAWFELCGYNVDSSIFSLPNGCLIAAKQYGSPLETVFQIDLDHFDSLGNWKDSAAGYITLQRPDTAGASGWHMVTVTVQAHGALSVYIDSVLVGTGNAGTMSPSKYAPFPMYLGSSNVLIDQVLILNEAIPASQVSTRFHEGGWYENYTQNDTTGTTSDTTSGQFVKATGSLFPIIYSVCFPDPQDGYGCGIYGTIAYSHDSGMTWTKGNSGIEDDLFGTSFTGSSTGLAVGGNAIPGGVIIRTTDAGQTWGQSMSNPWWVHPANSHVLRDVKFFPDGIHALCVGIDSSDKGMILTSTDAGITWSLAKTTSHALYSIGLSNLTGSNEYAVVVGDSGGDFSTSDMGITWEDNSNATTNFNQGTTNFRQVSLDPGTTQDFSATAISTNNATFWSTDMGQSWIERSFSGVGTPLNAVYALTGGKQAWVATEYAPPGGLYLTTDEGNTWTNEMPSSIRGETWSCIAARDAHHIAFIAQVGDVYWLSH